ncbi:MAG: 2-oxoglutarate dehydrogenase E1 subunit family protein, partial [Limisphaerales bacterium]
MQCRNRRSICCGGWFLEFRNSALLTRLCGRVDLDVVKDVPVQLAPGRHTESLDVATFSNLPFIEELYADYMRDPGSLTPEWREYFDNFVNG